MNEYKEILDSISQQLEDAGINCEYREFYNLLKQYERVIHSILAFRSEIVSIEEVRTLDAVVRKALMDLNESREWLCEQLDQSIVSLKLEVQEVA